MELKRDDTSPQRSDDERYEFVRKLGEGGSGVVHLVRDRETGEQLAWKRLQQTDEHSIARLKREFRTLSTINHKNVIRLYDLGRARDEWFLSMEYLNGPTLLDYLDSNAEASSTQQRSAANNGVDAIDLARILSVFHQLATGIHALHQRGVLHRDLKPSNVIVESGRVVVLDFGLALTVGDHAATVTMDGAIAGTPAYMAPEQLQGIDWGEPNDWYAFGVMLYEALTGYLPIEGRLQELLRRKLEQDPVPIERFVSGLPPAISRMCNALLSRQPELRPTGPEVLAVLDAHRGASLHPGALPRAANDPQTSVPRPTDGTLSLFGRDAERAQLHKAYDDVEQGGAAVVHVRGVSGSGKSALVERFLVELEQGEARHKNPSLILRGRCYERETVAFKALDAVLDALVQQMSREDDVEVSHTLPRDVQALAQLFPVLTRLSAVQRLLRPSLPTVAKPHAREAAESALRDMFARLCSRRTVIVWIDDLHWGDADSARILKGWLNAAPLPGLLLIFSYRSDEAATSPCLRLLLADREQVVTSEHMMQLGGLLEQHIRALCDQRFAGSELTPEARAEIVDHIVVEADGSPFLASQLAVLALSEISDKPIDAPEVLTIESLVRRRTEVLTAHARQLLHVLAVAGRPLPMLLAMKLSAAASNARAIVHELSGLGLIRSQISEGERQLAVYHDRLREAVLVSLRPAERTGLERELFDALELDGNADPAWLHALALASRQPASAARYGRIAAEEAMLTLAFERAAQLYQACLDLCEDGSPECLELWQKLALAFAHAGRGRQAAAAYHEAAERSSGLPRIKLERASASHLLRSGAFVEGEALIQKVLAAAKLSTPRSAAGLIAAIVWERTRLALRSVDAAIAANRAADESSRLLFEGELCGTLSIELQPYDPLRGALFQARSLRMALDYGTPALIARALCVAATMATVTGGAAGFARAQKLLARATELERARPSALVYGNIASARAVCAMLTGDMQGTVEYSGEAERMFREASGADEGEYYHRYTVITARVAALFELGQHELAASELTHAVNEARATHNIGALLLLSSALTRLEIMQGQATRAMQRLEAEHAQLPPQRFGLLHAYYLGSVMRVGCATGEHEWALRWMHGEFESMKHSVLKRGGPAATVVPALHARLLLNRAVALGHTAAQAEQAVADDLRTLTRSTAAAAPGVVARMRARLALMSGDRVAPRKLFEFSSSCFEKDLVVDEAARDRYALGAVIGGEQGAQLQATALLALRAHGYVDPRKDLSAYYPELFEPNSSGT
jgi:serine/threonine protein kinase/tetratricopeptide (TPR) repeat protein